MTVWSAIGMLTVLIISAWTLGSLLGSLLTKLVIYFQVRKEEKQRKIKELQEAIKTKPTNRCEYNVSWTKKFDDELTLELERYGFGSDAAGKTLFINTAMDFYLTALKFDEIKLVKGEEELVLPLKETKKDPMTLN